MAARHSRRGSLTTRIKPESKLNPDGDILNLTDVTRLQALLELADQARREETRVQVKQRLKVAFEISAKAEKTVANNTNTSEKKEECRQSEEEKEQVTRRQREKMEMLRLLAKRRCEQQVRQRSDQHQQLLIRRLLDTPCLYYCETTASREEAEQTQSIRRAFETSGISYRVMDLSYDREEREYVAKCSGLEILPLVFVDDRLRATWAQMEVAINGGYLAEFLSPDYEKKLEELRRKTLRTRSARPKSGVFDKRKQEAEEKARKKQIQEAKEAAIAAQREKLKAIERYNNKLLVVEKILRVPCIYTSETSGSLQTKKETQKMLWLFDAKKIPYRVVDLSLFPEEKAHVIECSSIEILPQVFICDKFRATWDEIEQANDMGILKEFLSPDLDESDPEMGPKIKAARDRSPLKTRAPKTARDRDRSPVKTTTAASRDRSPARDKKAERERSPIRDKKAEREHSPQRDDKSDKKRVASKSQNPPAKASRGRSPPRDAGARSPPQEAGRGRSPPRDANADKARRASKSRDPPSKPVSRGRSPPRDAPAPDSKPKGAHHRRSSTSRLPLHMPKTARAVASAAHKRRMGSIATPTVAFTYASADFRKML